MLVNARFYVQSISKHAQMTHTAVVLMPVLKATEDNISWSKYTPSGKIEMNVSNETGAAAWFESMLGKDIAITFEEATTE
jgi:hypothetical protein